MNRITLPIFDCRHCGGDHLGLVFTEVWRARTSTARQFRARCPVHRNHGAIHREYRELPSLAETADAA